MKIPPKRQPRKLDDHENKDDPKNEDNAKMKMTPN